MVPAPDVGLDPEEVLGIAEVVPHLGGHLVQRGEQVGERPVVGRGDRVLVIHDVEVHGPVVGVDHRLHGVAGVVEGVVEAAARGQLVGVGALGVRIHRTGRVRVEHVLDPPVDDHRVRVRVPVQEGGQDRHALLDVPDVHDPALVGDEVRDQRLQLAEAQGEGGLAQEGAHGHPTRAVVPTGDGLATGGLVVDLVAGRADDRVAVEILAHIDAGLVDGEGVVVGRDRDVTDHEVRTPLGGHGVGRGHGRPVAVGEGHPLAFPGLLGDARGAQLTGRDHHLGGLTVDLVPVHVQVVQTVEGPLGLEVLVGVGDHTRVQEADVAHRLLVVQQLPAGEVLVVVEGSGAHRVEAHGRPRGLDVALDVRRLPRGLGGLDPEVLDDRRVDAPDDHGHEAPEADGQDRQDPPPTPDVDDEQDHREACDHQQQVGRGQLRLHVGEERAVHGAPGRQRELVALEPVVGDLDQSEQGEEDRDVGLHLGGDPRPGVLHADPTIEVVGHGRDDEDDRQGGEQPGDHEGQERQLEDVEADVGVELRVLDAEVHPVGEQEPVVPLARHPGPGDQGEQQAHPDPDPARALVHDLVVPAQQLLLGAHGPEAGGDPVGDEQVDVAEDEEDPDEDQGEAGLGAEDRAERVLVAEGLEPQVVGVEAGDPAQGRDQHEEADGDQDQDDAAPGRQSSLPWAARWRHVRGGPHGRGSL